MGAALLEIPPMGVSGIGPTDDNAPLVRTHPGV